jgi:hypothetical protein
MVSSKERFRFVTVAAKVGGHRSPVVLSHPCVLAIRFLGREAPSLITSGLKKNNFMVRINECCPKVVSINIVALDGYSVVISMP